MSTQRSCDRCHAIKERCEWRPNSSTCKRCTRLQHACETRRPVKHPGRRPRPSIALAATSIPREKEWSCDPALVALRDVSGIERQVIQRLMTCDDSLENFLVGPTFCASHRRLIMSVVMTSTAELQDALLASCMAWLDDMPIESCDTYRKAALGLGKLSALEIANKNDATTCVTLGALLHTFALKLRVEDAYLICAEALGRIKPLYESERRVDSADYFMLTCMVGADMLECLLRCRMPTLRYKPPIDPAHVDRFVGLCGSLLPLLHDICELNIASYHADTTDGEAIREALSLTEHAVMNWMPPVPSGFATHFTSTETAHMLCQARVMRMAALLIIHRLRHSYDCETASALAMASTIMHELVITQHITNKQVRCVDLAILVACLEFDGADRDRWIQKSDQLLGYSTNYRRRIQGIIKTFWAAKYDGQKLFWYNLGDICFKTPGHSG